MEAQTFAEYLKQISLSIDIVNDATFTSVKSRMQAYFKELDIKFFEFLIPTLVDNRPGLQSEWHSGREDWANKLKNENGDYDGQISYSFDKDRTLCIVSENGGPLVDAEVYLNNWEDTSRKIELPKYVGLTKYNTYASVMIPLRGQNRRKIGIFNFEFGKKIEVTKKLQKELEALSEAFCTLYVLNRANNTQRQNTDQAIATLSKLGGFDINFKKPHIFVASSSTADIEVKESIKAVLDSYERKVTIRYWDMINDPGNIIQKIQTDIENSTYGICYFSEIISQGNTTTYRDNPNVLFEAGMIHALTQLSNKGPKKWIPIREHEDLTGPMPFDLATERHVIVSRTEGKLNTSDFKNKLKLTLDAMLGE